jgi:hypothetical protein
MNHSQSVQSTPGTKLKADSVARVTTDTCKALACSESSYIRSSSLKTNL